MQEKLFLDKIGIIINKEVLGDTNNPTQWEFPTVTKTGEATQVRIINLENHKVRHIINCINSIIESSISNPNRNQQWQDVSNITNTQWKYEEKNGDYTPAELDDFDEYSKDFFRNG